MPFVTMLGPACGVRDVGNKAGARRPIEILSGQNPHKPPSQFKYLTDRAGVVQFAVVDAAGRIVRSFSARAEAPGVHQVMWDGRDGSGNRVASGVYWLRVRMDGATEARRMILMK